MRTARGGLGEAPESTDTAPFKAMVLRPIHEALSFNFPGSPAASVPFGTPSSMGSALGTTFSASPPPGRPFRLIAPCPLIATAFLGFGTAATDPRVKTARRIDRSAFWCRPRKPGQPRPVDPNRTACHPIPRRSLAIMNLASCSRNSSNDKTTSSNNWMISIRGSAKCSKGSV